MAPDQPDSRAAGATDSAAAKRSSGGWGRWLRVGLGFGIIALLLTHIDLEAALRAVVEARVELLLLGFAIVLGSRLLAGVRWYVLLRGRHAALTPVGVLRLRRRPTFLPGADDVDLGPFAGTRNEDRPFDKAKVHLGS